MTITGIEIQDFRGIAHGRLEGLTALTVLTGKNGCGKSAVLDALLFGASADPLEAVGRIVKRHPQAVNGAQWLVRRGAESARTRLSGTEVTRWAEVITDPRHVPKGNAAIAVDFDGTSARELFGVVTFAPDNSYRVRRRAAAEVTTHEAFVRLIDPGEAKPLHDSYSAAVRDGQKPGVLGPLRGLLGPSADLEILTEEGASYLYLEHESGGVPVALAGDGAHSLIHTLVELGRCSGGVALLEEPEAFQHPSALRATAAAIVASVKRGLQVVLTTHSHELIDRLLDQASVQGLPIDQLTVATLELRGGELLSAARTGDALLEARQEFGEDLR